jgi:hypothetical protein
MDMDITSKVVYDEVSGIHSIPDFRTQPGSEALWLQVLSKKELPILPISLKVTG